MKTGETPTVRGGKGYWGEDWQPLIKNSLSAIAVYCRSWGVFPAAEIPGINPVSVKPNRQAKTGRCDRLRSNQREPSSD